MQLARAAAAVAQEPAPDDPAAATQYFRETATFKNDEVIEFKDEGYVKGASTTSAAPGRGDPEDHYLHESLFRWTGWSLVAPRPGRTLRAGNTPYAGPGRSLGH